MEKLSAIRKNSPPVEPGASPWDEAIAKATSEAVTTVDLTEVMKAVVARAKRGDPRAVQFLFDHLRSSGASSGAMPRDDSADPPKFLVIASERNKPEDQADVVKRKAMELIAEHGPQRMADLKERFVGEILDEVLNGNRDIFEVSRAGVVGLSSEGWHLAKTGTESA